ncbi:MAG TPA: hypothetical protein VKE96_33815, partial [Vicinamibacterales bacterium]|nr:hypothetical protein [Vicinamibacterales bacterium]
MPSPADLTTFESGLRKPSLDSLASDRPLSDGDALTNVRSAASSDSTPGGKGEGPLAIGQSFSGRYHIIRALGVGGMGAVYQAWDNELGVAVAIKVIRPDVM